MYLDGVAAILIVISAYYMPIRLSGDPEPDEKPLLSGSGHEQAPSMKYHKHRDGVGNDVNGSGFPGDLKSNDREGQIDGTASPIQPRVCGCGTTGRNLVVCIDGTSNQFGEKNTNVIELYKLIKKEGEDRQCTYYNSGIGTYAQPSYISLAYLMQVFDHKIDLAFALRFESILLDAYRWLSETYEKGDRIFLFGFSRGAYQVRTLSAMIYKIGLIHRGNEKQIPFAYQLYCHINGKLDGSGNKAKTFKDTFSRDVPVHFVGAWDTVSSVGIMRARKLLPETANGMQHVCYFRHALALDERRVKFLPEYARGGAGPAQLSRGSGVLIHTKEVWFAGTHSDIGGGNVDNPTLDKTRPPLRWMFSEASIAGLGLHPFDRIDHEEEDIAVHESLTGRFWWLLEYLPLRRPGYVGAQEGDGEDPTRRLHRGAGRVIQEGQKIHPSVWMSERLTDTDGYNPRAQLPSNPEFWTELKSKQKDQPLEDGTYAHPWKEVDLYDMVEYLFDQYIKSKSILPDDSAQRTQLSMIRIHAYSEEGRRALFRELGKHMKAGEPIHGPILYSILNILYTYSGNLVIGDSVWGAYREVRSRMSRHPKEANEKELRIADQFLAQFTDFQLKVLPGQESTVYSVAFSPDGKHIASGSVDRTIRIWDAETGLAVGKPFKGHNGEVNSVAFSPNGKYVVSGSDDNTIRIWDVETGQPVGKPFEGHSNWVCSVAYSPDGERIVSGSRDETLRLWDAKTGQTVGELLTGHTDTVCSVAYSPDSTRIASGSYDKTVRIWDAETGQPVGKPFEGHTFSVFSVAFSPDGKRIVSGSLDSTIRIWDVESGEMVGAPLKGHSNTVGSVVFSPNGKHIVSGSWDKTFRIWDVETGKMVGKPYEGHTDGVWSVAFSPDGKRVVSGSVDKTIRIWDVLEPLQPLVPEIEVHENADAAPSDEVSPSTEPSTIPDPSGLTHMY